MARTVSFPIPFSHPHVFKSALPKTAMDDSPGSSLLGLTTTVGAKIVGNASNNNQKTDVCGFLLILPENWLERSTGVIRARVKKDTTLAFLSDKVDITLKLQGDDAVGSDLITTVATQVTTSYANYDFRFSGATLRRGDHLWGTLTLDSNDTGGATNQDLFCSRLWAVLSVAQQ